VIRFGVIDHALEIDHNGRLIAQHQRIVPGRQEQHVAVRLLSLFLHWNTA